MGEYFDELTKALATGQSRRVALRRLVGGAAIALTALLPWTGSTPASAHKDDDDDDHHRRSKRRFGINGTFPINGKLRVNGHRRRRGHLNGHLDDDD